MKKFKEPKHKINFGLERYGHRTHLTDKGKIKLVERIGMFDDFYKIRKDFFKKKDKKKIQLKD